MVDIPELNFEYSLWGSAILHVAGIDEAGRGAWAGPVSAGAVILPPDPGVRCLLEGVRDSKQMPAAQRTRWANVIRAVALDWGVGFASHAEIDTLGILPATRLAMSRALAQMVIVPQHLLIDAVRLPVDIPQTAIIHGDALCLSIAAASVLAKTARDEWMEQLDRQYPGYAFGQHKGYGTEAHQAALDRLGPCGVHRCSYAPIALRIESMRDA